MVLQLSFNDFLQLRGAKGAAIEVLDGRVWITEDGRGGDLFLDSGRSYRVAGGGLVVVGAEDRLHYARVQVRKPALGFLVSIFNVVREKRRQLETRRQLSRLSDRMLEDIGLRRDQIP
jgi:uncharacterized protein YjiS (DUF1127 family)